MNIKIKRQCNNGRVIDGSLIINGEKVCHTAENAHSALCTGTYNIHIRYCKQYQRQMPMVDISECECIKDAECTLCEKVEYVSLNSNLPTYCPMLKPGNGAYTRTDGSILLGESIAPGCLIHPLKHFNSVYDRIRKALGRHKEVKLQIE